MADQPRLTRPEQSGQIQRPAVTEWVDIRANADTRQNARRHSPVVPQAPTTPRTSQRGVVHTDDQRARGPTGSGTENLVEQGLGLVLVGLLGQRQLTHQNLPRLGEHPRPRPRPARRRSPLPRRTRRAAWPAAHPAARRPPRRTAPAVPPRSPPAWPTPGGYG